MKGCDEDNNEDSKDQVQGTDIVSVGTDESSCHSSRCDFRGLVAVRTRNAVVEASSELSRDWLMQRLHHRVQ